jgi:acetyl-CoA carboxylase carboxyl transferase subunit alpha
MKFYLDFEKPLEELDLKLDELRQLQLDGDPAALKKLSALEKKAEELRDAIFSKLTPWQTCLLARHNERPHTLDYIARIAEDFIELRGDRRYGDDLSVVAALATVAGASMMIVGHQKGRDIKERIKRNFGQPHPEGYRKALRVMKIAERFKIPVVTLIDTPGAYPGIGAEERGQSEAIATNLMELSRLKTPIVSVVIGEGGSGGALALGVADRLYMLEHSIYSIISPEGCSAILLSNGTTPSPGDFSEAAAALKLTAKDLLGFKIIDAIIEEPPGGAHRNPDESAKSVKKIVVDAVKTLKDMPVERLLEERYARLRGIGVFVEPKM